MRQTQAGAEKTEKAEKGGNKEADSRMDSVRLSRIRKNLADLAQQECIFLRVNRFFPEKNED